MFTLYHTLWNYARYNKADILSLISVVVVVNVACTWDDTIGCLCRVTCVVILGKSSSILSLGGENVANICCSARVGIFLNGTLHHHLEKGKEWFIRRQDLKQHKKLKLQSNHRETNITFVLVVLSLSYRETCFNRTSLGPAFVFRIDRCSVFILQSVHLLYKYAIRINFCFIRTRRINFPGTL
jgi:hypothetical protein